ncbi:hypothetical protein ISN76_04785 [Dyella halodurans]|uniref:Uncharacterized protein n=1 Tax=Dyella halodurans TaxID=1920171 RepID=A0ABV9C2L0_9GAMM|nr:hypothetical protein [Dyella halodurans]
MSDQHSFVAPTVLVKDQFADGHHVVTSVAGSLHPYDDALAPAALYDPETERIEAFPLHKLVGGDGDLWTFRSYGREVPMISIVGQSYVFRPWWTRRTWDLVRDASRVWTKATYPQDGSHVHCEITFAQIGAGENVTAYMSDRAWITSEAYERFIRRDEFHCRE